MKRFRLTASGLWLAFICLGSVLIERASESHEGTEKGIAIHSFLEAVNRLGRDAALEQIADAQIRAVCSLIDVERLPVDPARYAAEVAYAWDVVSGRGRELGRAIGRDYSAAVDTEICGTADVVGLLDDVALVPDYKSGHKHVQHPAQNWQFRFLGLAAARTYGKDRAIGEVIRIRDDGETPYRIAAEYDAFDLAGFAEELRELHAEASRYAASGERPPLHVGAWCADCPALRFCPAQKELVQSFGAVTADGADRDALLANFEEGLTQENLPIAYGKLKSILAYGGKAMEVIERVGAKWPFATADGKMYGPHETKREWLNGTVVWDVIKAAYGEDIAWAAVELKASKTGKGKSIDTAVRKIAAETGKKITHLNREILEEVRRRGGSDPGIKTSVGEYTPKQLKGGKEVES